MKASLGVIASLFISPAYAFENLIIESTFQYPVEVTGNAASWSDAQMTAPASVQGRNSWAVPGFAAAPNFPAVPNLAAGPNLIVLPSPAAIPNLAALPIFLLNRISSLAHRRLTKALRPKSLAIFPTLS